MEGLNKIVERYNGLNVEKMTLGRRNEVFKFDSADDDKAYTIKFFKNKYFPTQMEHETNVLTSLPVNILRPSLVEKGICADKNYMVIEMVNGIPIFNNPYSGYEKDVSDYLKSLHESSPVIDTKNVDYDHSEFLDKVVKKMPSEIYQLYKKTKFNPGEVSFIHYHPHFRHFIKNDDGLYLVDWEDATYGSKQVDYASFIKDQIENRRPQSEVLSFARENPSLEDCVNPYLGVLYCIDWYFSDSPQQSTADEMLEKSKIFFSNDSFEKSIGDIYDN